MKITEIFPPKDAVTVSMTYDNRQYYHFSHDGIQMKVHYDSLESLDVRWSRVLLMLGWQRTKYIKVRGRSRRRLVCGLDKYGRKVDVHMVPGELEELLMISEVK